MVTGCKKDNDIQLEDKTISQDDAYAESTFENVSDMADEAYDIGTGNHLKSYPGRQDVPQRMCHRHARYHCFSS